MAAHLVVHSSSAVYNVIPLFIHPGGTGTTVAVDAGQQTLNVHGNGRHNSATGTITAGSSTTYTPAQSPVYLAVPSGATSLTISGQGY